MALTSLAHWLCTLIEICFGLVGKKAAEKGHVIPKDHLDSKEKELIKVATKGVVSLFIFPMNFPAADDSVVRLFNAVTKAQKPRKDLNPSRTKDAKGIFTFMLVYCSHCSSVVCELFCSLLYSTSAKNIFLWTMYRIML